MRARHTWLWDSASWAFKYGTDSVTVTSGSATVTSLPDDFGSAISLMNSDGAFLQPIRDYREFYERYNANLAASGSPEAFTVIGGSILVGPTPTATASDYLLIYKKLKPTLENDSDATGLPDGYDLALVHGGKAEGFKLATIPLWQGFDEDFLAQIEVMKETYLTTIDGAQESFSGAYRPDVWR